MGDRSVENRTGSTSIFFGTALRPVLSTLLDPNLPGASRLLCRSLELIVDHAYEVLQRLRAGQKSPVDEEARRPGDPQLPTFINFLLDSTS